MSPRPSRAASRGPQSRPRSVAPIKIPHGACAKTSCATASAAASGVYEASAGCSTVSTRSAPKLASNPACRATPASNPTATSAPPSLDASSSPRESSSSVPRVMRPSRSVSHTIHRSRPRMPARRAVAIGRRSCTRGFSAPIDSSADITSVAARSGSLASINLGSVFGVVTTRTSCTHVGEPASPNSFASAPSSAARTTSIGLVAASSAAPGFTLTGCATRSAHVMTAGIAASTSSKPSSLSRSARSMRPSISSLRAPVICAAPISSAISGPTCPVSASSEYLPSMMRSNFPRASHSASARAVASVSAPANARSSRCTA